MREKIIAALQPLIDGFVDQVVLLAEQQAKSLIRERLSSLLETDVRGAGSAIPERSVPEPAVPAKQGSTSSTRKPMTCSKCGAVGFTATTCGKTHNVSTSPAVGPIAIPRPAQETSPPATPSIKLVDRKPPPNKLRLRSYRCHRGVRTASRRSTQRRTVARSFASSPTCTGSTAN